MEHKEKPAQLSPQDDIEMRCQTPVDLLKSRRKRSRRVIPSALHSGSLRIALVLLALISVCYTLLFGSSSDRIRRLAAILADLDIQKEQKLPLSKNGGLQNHLLLAS